MKNKNTIILGSGLVILGCLAIPYLSDKISANSNVKENNLVLTSSLTGMDDWPETSKMAVKEITDKYGKPDATNAEEQVWMNKGVWKKICINKKESKHSFPIEHTDMMSSTIMYKVPVDKMDELGKFDGSVTFDRTQGTMSARCDQEANNFLALNLAHDIITDKKSVEEARTAYALSLIHI